jgi:hypothetical protein
MDPSEEDFQVVPTHKVSGGLVRRLLTVPVVAVLAVGSFGSAVFAQSTTRADTQYELATGNVLEWSSPWEIDAKNSGYVADIAGDIVTLWDGDIAQFSVTTLPAIVTPDAALGQIEKQYAEGRDDFAVVDSDGDTTGAYGVYTFTGSDGAELGSFNFWTVTDDGQNLVSTELIASIDGFGDEVANVQDGVTVDGDTIWNGVDGDNLAAEMAAGSSEKQPKDVKKTGRQDKKEATPEDNGKTGKKGKSGKADIDPAFEEAGLIDATSYESPQFGYSVTWEGDWMVNPGDDEAVTSDVKNATDSLYLGTEEPAVSLLGVTGIAADGATPADIVDYWVSDDFLGEYAAADTEVLLSDSTRKGGAVVTVGSLSDDQEIQVVTLREVISPDGGDTLVTLTLVVPVEDFADIYESAQVSIVVDGDSALGFFATDDVVNVLP